MSFGNVRRKCKSFLQNAVGAAGALVAPHEHRGSWFIRNLHCTNWQMLSKQIRCVEEKRQREIQRTDTENL